MSEIRARLAEVLEEHFVVMAKCEEDAWEQWEAGVDALLSLPGIAIVELPEPLAEDVDDEDHSKLKGDYLKRDDSKSEVWVEGLPGSPPYVFFGRRYHGPSYMPAEYARDVAAALLAAANAAERSDT